MVSPHVPLQSVNTEPSPKVLHERGASLVEYGVVLAVFVLGTLSGVQFLTAESSKMLVENGGQIGEPRPYAVDIVNTTLPPPSEWSETTVPAEAMTFYDIEIRNGSGCLRTASRQIRAGACDGSEATWFSLENVEDNIYRITSTATLQCWEADGRRGPPLTTGTCAGDDDELWYLAKLDQFRFTLESTVSGNCIEMGAKLVEARCQESEAQIFTLPGGET